MARGIKITEALADAVIRLASDNHSPEEIAFYTGVSRRSQRRIFKKLRATGRTVDLEPEVERRGRPRRLTAEEALCLRTLVLDRDEQEFFLDEAQDAMLASTGKTFSIATLWRALERCGLTIKKVTKKAGEASKIKRAKYTVKIGGYDANQLVFTDESACDKRTTYRNRAYSLRGTRAVRKTVFIRGKRYSILPAMSLDGILAVDIVEGSFNYDSFAAFIDGLLAQMNPYPQPNSVIVMDNCRIHKNPEVLQMIEDRGMKYVFLPPYSPDFNPIELAFSSIKAYIRRFGSFAREAMEDGDEDVYAFLTEAVYSVTKKDAEGWFYHCGYF